MEFQQKNKQCLFYLFSDNDDISDDLSSKNVCEVDQVVRIYFNESQKM